MVSLELLIDASGMERGAAQATRALGSVTSGAQAAERNVGNLNRAFAGTSGFASAGTAIASAASAFDRLNISSAGFAASNAIVAVGRSVQDFALLGGRIGTVASAFARFNPYLLVASTALSAVSALMSVFGRDSDETTRSLQQQTNALDGLLSKLSEVRVRAGYGGSDPRTSVSGTVDTLTALRTSPSRSFSASEAAALFGVTEQELRYALARGGLGESALEVRQKYRPRYDASGQLRPTPDGFEFARQSFTSADLVGAGQSLLGQRRDSIDSAEQSVRQAKDLAKIQEDTERRRQEQAQAFAEQMERSIEQARRFGEQLGDGVADAVLGLRSGREVLASMVQDLARLGIREATGSLFAAARGALQNFGTTGAQQGAGGGGGVVV